MLGHDDDDDDVYYYICWRLKLAGETENMGVWTKQRCSMKAGVLMATPCPNSLHGKHTLSAEGGRGCGG